MNKSCHTSCLMLIDQMTEEMESVREICSKVIGDAAIGDSIEVPSIVEVVEQTIKTLREQTTEDSNE